MVIEGWEENFDFKKFYVVKLKFEIINDIVTKYFSNFGVVIEVKIVKDNEDKLRGFAFVIMFDYSVVDIILEYRLYIIDG